MNIRASSKSCHVVRLRVRSKGGYKDMKWATNPFFTTLRVLQILSAYRGYLAG